MVKFPLEYNYFLLYNIIEELCRIQGDYSYSARIKESPMTLQEIIDDSKRIVFFGGAGVSTESGIPDFRSEDGLYHQHFKYPPEQMLSYSFYKSHPAEFYRFYREKMIAIGYKPNAAHYKLAELEKAGKLSAVITQNIDGLHTDAGSKNVIAANWISLSSSVISANPNTLIS